jgi:hypothetical protein
MSRQVATAYTGANISITIGGKFIANAFGISWELSQNKRPIYGYNSMYYDSVASGQVIVMGQIYINYQHPNYLSSLLSSYFKNEPLAALNVAGFGETSSRNGVNGVLNTYTNRGGSARQNRNFNEDLNAIFDDPAFMANLGSVFTSGQSISGFKNFKNVINRSGKDDQGNRVIERFNQGDYDLIDNDSSALAFVGNLDSSSRRQENVKHLRPDQFTNNGSANVDSIDIVVTHGDPGLNDKSSGILSYTPASSIILRGIHFIGEAQQVMADDQPIMETYKFIARSKEALISATIPPPEPVAPGQNTANTGEAGTNSVADMIATVDAARLEEINNVRREQGLTPLTELPKMTTGNQSPGQ